MTSPAVSAFALESANERAAALRKEIERLKGKDYAFDLPRQLLDIFQKAAEKAQASIASLSSDPVLNHPDTPEDERLGMIRTRSATIVWLQQALQLLDKVDSSRLPFEFTRAFEQLASATLAGKDVRLMLSPVRSFNYSLIDIAALLQKIGLDWKTETETATVPFVLGFPAAEPNAVTLHTLFLHEIGHALFQGAVGKHVEQLITSAIAAAQQAKGPAVEAELRRNLPAAPASTRTQQRTIWEPIIRYQSDMEFASAAKKLGEWVEEIFCDLCAVRLAGPAFVCAFKAFFLPFIAPAQASDSHPSPSVRLRLMHQFLLKQRADLPVVDSICRKHFGMHADEVTGIRPQPIDALSTRIAEEILASTNPAGLVASVFRIVESSVPVIAEPAQFEAALDRGLEHLDHMIPPNPLVHGMPPSCDPRMVVVFVLYSVWIFKLKKYGSWSAHNWPPERNESILNQLALKALEAADLERRYASQRT